jgi:L-amino acid N-acyltransferase YncA
MLTIEPFTYSEDYRVAIAINAAVFDEPPDTLAEWKHDDETLNPDYPYYRDLVLRDGTVIAYVETYQNQFAYHSQKYECRIFVHPAHDAPDIRPAVLAHTLERLRDCNLIAITSGMLDDKPEAMRFFEDYGFNKITEEKISKLDVRRCARCSSAIQTGSASCMTWTSRSIEIFLPSGKSTTRLLRNGAPIGWKVQRSILMRGSSRWMANTTWDNARAASIPKATRSSLSTA